MRGFPLSQDRHPRQFPRVRIPIPVVILLCLSVVGGAWWYGTRHRDFLTPPPESKLAAVRASVGFPLRPADHPVDPPAAPGEPPPGNTPEPALRPGDFDLPPNLAEYREDAVKGAAPLQELAALLETKGQAQRALLAWERAIDSATEDQDQMRTAIASIKRLRAGLSDWNTDPAATLAITLHAGTGKSTASILTPVLEDVAREIERASAGILKVSVSVASGRDIPSTIGPAPVALWLAGPVADSRSSEVMAFTLDSPEVLHADILRTLFKLIRGYVERTTFLRIPVAISEHEDPADMLQSHITRLAWQELGIRLNLPPE
jgi:hypothetical protein